MEQVGQEHTDKPSDNAEALAYATEMVEEEGDNIKGVLVLMVRGNQVVIVNSFGTVGEAYDVVTHVASFLEEHYFTKVEAVND